MVGTFPENTEEPPEIWMNWQDFEGSGDVGFNQPGAMAGEMD